MGSGRTGYNCLYCAELGAAQLATLKTQPEDRQSGRIQRNVLYPFRD